MLDIQGCQGWTDTPVKPTEDGWYKVQLGRFGTINLAGNLVNPLDVGVIGKLTKRINDQSGIYGEHHISGNFFRWNIPDGYLEINHQFVSHRIRNIEVKLDTLDGCGIQYVFGEVKPMGPSGYILEEALKDTKRNLRFGYRGSIGDIASIEGVLHKALTVVEVVTFDLMFS